jgi:GT2 family glycosyltransferase
MAIGTASARSHRELVNDVLPVSVVVPTIGRPALLEGCLESLAACAPLAAEILVVDQSDDDAVSRVVAAYLDAGARRIASSVRNRGVAVNLGMHQARNDVVLVTDDDCIVAGSWVGTAWSHLSRDPTAIVTGCVIPLGHAASVTSTIADERRRDFTGELHYGALSGGNMACSRSLVLEFGGFDERVNVAEDNDLCYRWLRASRRLHYEPDLLIWHRAWRTPAELDRQYLAYGRGQGVFYAKHLRARDIRVARFLARDVYRAARGVAAGVVRGPGEWPDPRKGLLRGLAVGLVEGWRTFRPRANDVTTRQRRARDETAR